MSGSDVSAGSWTQLYGCLYMVGVVLLYMLCSLTYRKCSTRHGNVLRDSYETSVGRDPDREQRVRLLQYGNGHWALQRG